MSNIKRLNSQLKSTDKDIASIQSEVDTKIKLIKILKKKKNEIKNQIKRIENDKEIKVSEHALLRYIERIDNYDIEKLIKYLSNDQKLKDTLEVVGSNAKVAIDDCILVVKNNIIVTINGKAK